MNLIYEHAPTASLIFFFLFFLWMAFLAYRPSAKEKLKALAFIPLMDEENTDEQ